MWSALLRGLLRNPRLPRRHEVQSRSVSSQGGPDIKKKFKLPISLMGVWWFVIGGLPIVLSVAYFRPPTLIAVTDERYGYETAKNEAKISSAPREKVPLTQPADDSNPARPWERYGVSKNRFRQVQQKNDANIAAIHKLIKNTSKKGPSAWRD